jgi:hypothetical protein
MSVSPRLSLTQWVQYLIRWGSAVFDGPDGVNMVDEGVKFELTDEEDSIMELIRLALDLLSRLVSQADGKKLSALADEDVLAQFFAQNKRRFELIVGNECAVSIVEYCQHCSELLNGVYSIYCHTISAKI